MFDIFYYVVIETMIFASWYDNLTIIVPEV